VDHTSLIRSWAKSSWEIALGEELLTIQSAKLTAKVPLDGSILLDAKRKWFRWQLTSSQGWTLKLSGMSKYEAKLIAYSVELCKARNWSKQIVELQIKHRKLQVWVPKESIEEIILRKPTTFPRNELNQLKRKVDLSPAESQAQRGQGGHFPLFWTFNSWECS